MIQWFLSGTVRQADAMCKHVEKILHHQRDILAPKALEEVETALREVRAAIKARADNAALQTQINKLEEVAGKWLKPYPNAAWRENVEVLLVALAVALGIRTFFVQPFKIPTGSMQPTLFGITSHNLLIEPDAGKPGGLARIKDWCSGASYLEFKAGKDGTYDGMSRPLRLLIFDIKQTVWFAGEPHSLWFPPDTGTSPPIGFGDDNFLQRMLKTVYAVFVNLPADEQVTDIERRADLHRGTPYHQGQDVLKLKVNSGDHLFIDRLTYNFIPPSRGQIVVFETKGIPEDRRMTPYWSIPDDQFYIKRLVGLSGENIQVGDDRHLIIDGKRLDWTTPHFENVYGFDSKVGPRDSHFSGHVSAKTSHQPIPLFKDESTVYQVAEGNVMVMGDNTMNSLDSRFWGDFPATSIIGRAFSVYWPITDRFGWNCLVH